ncbi:hypothetical protein [Mucilaginibacter pedocola]|uniref:Outer membrane protein beta-barrel domain-containing protein n=1 Tax=Mucilaginibacter pedocola TaxID=1792845 RepID=A0A1S9PAQ1_9SPHI|nr:hypothetical protein [Mucilaginibacter pedocola]OOQ58011.1 hypothetical protein BC343_10125 [Mucilaginibacter pedocola]
MSPNVNLRIKCSVTLLSILFSVFIFSSANAQRGRGMNADGDVLGGSNASSGGSVRRDGWLMAFNGGYESPLGDVKQSYKGSPTYGVSVMRRMGNWLYSGTVDYRSYKPINDTLSISYDDVNYYGGTFSKYKGVGLYLGAAYEIPLGDINFYAGLNGGVIMVSYKITIDDPNFSSTESVSNMQNTYIAPKLGLNFMVSRNIGLAMEGRYSLGTVGASYNSRSGGSTTKGFNSIAGNLFLTYSF